MPLGAARITLLAFSPSVVAEAEVIRKKMGVSAIGDAQVDTAQSKFGGASAVFDGTGDRLETPNTGIKLGTEITEWTVEGWLRVSTLPNTFKGFLSNQNGAISGGGGSNNGWGAYINSSNQLQWIQNVGATTRKSTTSISANTWHHFAFVRNGSSFKIFLDGTEEYTTSSYSNSTDVDNNIFIGTSFNISSGYNGLLDLSGHIDEVRISNIARYTTTFTPSTTPFVNDNNTLLLLHMDGTDGSTLFEDDNGIGWQLDNLVYTGRSFDVGNQDGLPRAIAISNDGTRLIMSGTAGDSIYSYTLSTPWDISTATYDSVSISASNSVPSGLTFSPDGTKMFGSGANPTSLDAWNLSTAWDISTASQTSAYDFSPEMTFCNDIRFDLNGDKMFLLAGNSSTNAHKVHQYSLSTAYDTTTETYDNVILDHSSQTTNAFSIAFSYDGKKLFIISTNETIYEYSLPTAYNLTSASYTTSYDISNEHTDSFGIAYNLIGTRIYILDEDTQIIHQYSVAPRAEISVSANGNAQVDTAQSKFGGASALFDGADDYLEISADPITIGSGDGTFEGWVRFVSASTSQNIFDYRSTGNGSYPSVWNNGGNLGFYYEGDYRIQSSGGLSDNTWHHWALVKDGNDFELFLDGTSQGTYTDTSGWLAQGSVVTMGTSATSGTFDLNGHLDEIRVSNTARYTANFTPSTEPFQNDDNTLLLLHMDGTDGSTVFVDDNGVLGTNTVEGGGAEAVTLSGIAFDTDEHYYKTSFNAGSTTNTKEVTVSYWFKALTDTSENVSLAIRNSSGKYIIGSWLWKDLSAKMRFLTDTSSTYDGTTTETSLYATDDGWHHVVFSLDFSSAGSAQCYVDGVATTITSNGTGNELGWDNTNLGIYINGRPVQDYANEISQVFIDNKYYDLSADISMFYNNGPVDMGTDGTSSGLTQPLIYHYGDTTNFPANNGTWSYTLTATGTPEDSTTGPGE